MRQRVPATPLGTPPPHEPGPVRRWIHGALFENVGLKFLSLVLAVTVFLLVNTDRDHEIIARVGVSYTLPDNKVLISQQLEDVRVTVKGPWRRLRSFDERHIPRINLDLRNAPSGDIPITPDMIHLPVGLRIESISPSSVHVAFDRRADKLVEVTPQVTGTPLHGYVVSEVKVVPPTVKVRGAASTINALVSVRTREVPVDGHAASFTAETAVVPPDGVKLIAAPKLLVHVTIDEELVSRKVPSMPVAVRGDGVDPTRWRVSPTQVVVTLTGALLDVEKLVPVPYVTLSATDTKAQTADVSVDGVPPGIGVKLSPERVKVIPLPRVKTP